MADCIKLLKLAYPPDQQNPAETLFAKGIIEKMVDVPSEIRSKAIELANAKMDERSKAPVHKNAFLKLKNWSAVEGEACVFQKANYYDVTRLQQ